MQQYLTHQKKLPLGPPKQPIIACFYAFAMWLNFFAEEKLPKQKKEGPLVFSKSKWPWHTLEEIWKSITRFAAHLIIMDTCDKKYPNHLRQLQKDN
jgi:hypothetical protein